jgi:hypothetical protein
MEEARKKELLTWMDTQIAIRVQMKKERCCGDTVVACCESMLNGVQIYTGIQELSRAAGGELKYISTEYLTEFHFIYKETRFFQLIYEKVSFTEMLKEGQTNEQ